jgi:hypothetical protein
MMKEITPTSNSASEKSSPPQQPTDGTRESTGQSQTFKPLAVRLNEAKDQSSGMGPTQMITKEQPLPKMTQKERYLLMSGGL